MTEESSNIVEMTAHEKVAIESHFVFADRKVIAVWYWRNDGKKYTGYLRLEEGHRLSLEIRHLPYLGRRIQAFIDGKVDHNVCIVDESEKPRWSSYYGRPGIKYWRFKREHLRMMKNHK